MADHSNVQYIGRKICVHGVDMYVGVSTEDYDFVKFQIDSGPLMTFTSDQARAIGKQFIKYADIVDAPPFEEFDKPGRKFFGLKVFTFVFLLPGLATIISMEILHYWGNRSYSPFLKSFFE